MVKQRKVEQAERAGAKRTSTGESLPEQLLWLADAPLFIDEKQVEAFYDAVLQPDYEEIGQSFNESVSAETKIGGSVTAGAAFPWLAKAEVQGSVDRTKGKGEDRGWTWNRVTNPYRHLLALALRYASEDDLKSRLVFTGDGGRCVCAAGGPVDLSDVEFSRKSPRAIVMLDLESGTRFVPTALELTDGRVVRLFEQLAQRFQQPGAPSLPEHPKEADPGSAQAKAYWQWFIDYFDRQKALEVVEEAVEGGQIAWIDYRFKLGDSFPHVHLAARGSYETGAFAYQVIARGLWHGLRIVGTLKSEPDINVLAIFER